MLQPCQRGEERHSDSTCVSDEEVSVVLAALFPWPFSAWGMSH